MIYRAPQIFISDHAENMLFALWRAGKDTYEIARAIGFPESAVANRLWILRNRRMAEEAR